MTNLLQRIVPFVIALCLYGCGDGQHRQEDTVGTASEADKGLPYIVELRAVGKRFEGPAEIESGWTTFSFVNESNMTHFAILDVPPDGVDAREMSDAIMQPFQDAMDAMNAGNDEAAAAAFGKMPPWIGDLGRAGGPGFLSPGLTGQTTVYLEPGHYILECYVKSNGIFHSTSPGRDQLGMIMDLVVTTDGNGAPEPKPDATLAITNSGFELVDGELGVGSNTIQVDFGEQQALPSFVGNDVHVIRVEGPSDIIESSRWMDWRAPNGLEDPSPATFIGGINDLPAGEHGYVTLELVPGDYAFIAEMPDPLSAGFVLPFSIQADR